MVEIINIFVQKDYLKQRVLLQAENDVQNVCWYCKSCERRKRFYAIKDKLKKERFQ